MTVVAFTTVLAATIFLTVETFKGVLEYTIREPESCPPAPPEPARRIATWLLIVAFAAFDAYLIKAVLK